ncbi:PIR protein [Plasmodium ovale]|uniref:PIR Superfamily Protein n=2 Tax=Plasmodium ovale TaxID=36330 RepID=A0A1A8X9Y6_PLAOA|nr:PIR Superfamily Protein [Plasmodium ovale curtisi]SBT00642.1 PIR Superfamily Protein [Plasmodium ovale curtisi]SBT84874.1 PIR protein [Plasmodium ovale]
MGIEEDPDMGELQSEIIYHKLKNNPKDYTKDNNDFWKTTIAKHPMKVLDIYPTLVKGIYFVSTMNEGEYAFYDERWNYLYFWTGIKLIENSEDPEDLEDSDSSYFSQLMNLLKMVRSFTDKKKVPYDENMLMINTGEFKNLKQIYDYLQNYQPIQWKVGFSGISSCTARYKEYITTTHDLYANEKQRCQKDTGNYCKAVKRFALTYDKNNIRKLSCDGKKDPSKQHEMKDTEVELMGSRSPDSLHSGASQPLYSPSTDGEQSRSMASPAGDISFSSGSTNVISTVFPLLGTASLAFFFLKFTPLGSSLYNRIFSKEIIRTNVEPQELLENNYEFSNTNIEENSHHIGYHNM